MASKQMMHFVMELKTESDIIFYTKKKKKKRIQLQPYIFCKRLQEYNHTIFGTYILFEATKKRKQMRKKRQIL